MAPTSAVVLSFSDRATDKAHSILKECADNLAQAVSSLPPTDPGARQNTSSQDDAMDTSGSASKMVCFYSFCFFTCVICSVQVPGGLSGTRTIGMVAASSLVHSQDMELCSVIDQLIGT